MNKKFLLLISLLIVVSAIGTWFYFVYLKEIQPPTLPQQDTTKQEPEGTKTAEFVPLKSQLSPPFIKPLNNAKDIKIGFYYEGESGFGWPEPEFYTPEGSEEKFLSLSKLKEREGKYAYGPDYHEIFSSEGSHWYGGAPVYLLNKDSKYSVSYIGLQINDRDLISELKIEFGIDYLYGGGGVGKSKSSIFASIFGIESVYACGPGIYLRRVGDSNLTFVEESNGIAWYRLEKPVALYNLNFNYCDDPPTPNPSYCNNEADDPEECWDYCYYNASISSLENGNLKMHILYKPNDKEGFFKLQMVNLILTDSAGAYYQPTMGENFDHYYRAYLH